MSSEVPNNLQSAKTLLSEAFDTADVYRNTHGDKICLFYSGIKPGSLCFPEASHTFGVELDLKQILRREQMAPFLMCMRLPRDRSLRYQQHTHTHTHSTHLIHTHAYNTLLEWLTDGCEIQNDRESLWVFFFFKAKPQGQGKRKIHWKERDRDCPTSVRKIRFDLNS